MKRKAPKKGGPKQTRVPFTNVIPAPQMHSMIEEFSLSQAEKHHIETLEEANDFNIGDDDDDFFKNQTVYEMHDQAEENMALFQQNFPPETDQEEEAESNETEDSSEIQNPKPSHEVSSEPTQPAS